MMKGMISKYNSLMGDSCIASLSSFVFRLSSVLLFLAVSSFAAQSSYDLMERANALYRDGKFKQAIMLYRKAESRGADPVATSFNIANSYYQQNDLPNAAATYRKAIDFRTVRSLPLFLTWRVSIFGSSSIPNAWRRITVR